MSMRPVDFLDDPFEWSKTPQGDTYWINIRRNWKTILKGGYLND